MPHHVTARIALILLVIFLQQTVSMLEIKLEQA
jgi:hypothetical protein